jgi:hypothetical protein
MLERFRPPCELHVVDWMSEGQFRHIKKFTMPKRKAELLPPT